MPEDNPHRRLSAVAHLIIRSFDTLSRGSEFLARILLIAMVVIISVNVFMRYVLNSGLRWGEEIALVLVGWFVFLAIPMGVRKKLHISLHLWRRQIPILDAVLERVAAAGVLILGIVLFVYGNQIIGVAMQSIMPASRLPSGILYLILPLSSVLMMYEAVTDLVGYDTNAAEAEDEITHA